MISFFYFFYFICIHFHFRSRRKTADAMRLPLQQFHFMYCFTFTLYCTIIVARINYLSILSSIEIFLTFHNIVYSDLSAAAIIQIRAGKTFLRST